MRSRTLARDGRFVEHGHRAGSQKREQYVLSPQDRVADRLRLGECITECGPRVVGEHEPFAQRFDRCLAGAWGRSRARGELAVATVY